MSAEYWNCKQCKKAQALIDSIAEPVNLGPFKVPIVRLENLPPGRLYVINYAKLHEQHKDKK